MKRWNTVRWDAASDPSAVTWSYPFLGGVPGSSYWVQGRTTDWQGNVAAKSTWPSTNVSVAEAIDGGDGGDDGDDGEGGDGSDTSDPLPDGTVPEILGTSGGSGHAGMYPSGMEIAPDGSVVVANTGDDAVQKYSADGTLLWRVGEDGNGDGQFNNPRDIGLSLIHI